jgi:hypothetical protein
MSKYLAGLKRVLTPEGVGFLTGVLASLIAKAFSDKTFTLDETLVFIFVGFFIIFSVATIARINHEIEKSLPQPKLSARVLYITQTREGEAALYKQLAETILSARKSVYAISVARQSELGTAPHRKRYYEQVNKMLESKLRHKEIFRFERIVQVNEVREGKLEPDQMDPLIFEHCQLLLRLNQVSGSVRVRLRQLPQGISSIAFFIVDNEKIVFLIPNITTKKDKEALAGTGIFISDPEGTLANELMLLFEDFTDTATDVGSMPLQM